MLNEIAMSSFTTLAVVAQEKALNEYKTSMRSINALHSKNGTLQSGVYLLSLDRAAAKAIENYAQELFSIITKAVSVEKKDTSASSRNQVALTYDIRLREFAATIIFAYTEHTKNVRERLKLNTNKEQSLKTLEWESEIYKAKIQLLFLGMETTGMTAQGVNNTFNIGGSVGAIQTANNAQAVVTQNNIGGAENVIEALKTILQALNDSPALNIDQRREAQEIVQDVMHEASKAKPNRSKLGALLGGVKGTIEVVSAAGPAWQQVTSWYEALMRAVS